MNMSKNPQRIGKYELQERLRLGELAETWKALDIQSQSHVTIKILQADLQIDHDFFSRFLREAPKLASVHHSNIVPIYDIQTSRLPETDITIAYIARDYVEGPTLADYIYSASRLKKFPPAAD